MIGLFAVKGVFDMGYRFASQIGKPSLQRQSSGVALAALMTALPVSPADAQTQAATASDGQPTMAGGVEDIVVTARRRSENLQDTPISISAFSAAGIESRQIQQVSGIAQFTPALTFETAAPIAGSSSAAVMFIRGIGQVESIPTVDLGVGLYVDGVYLARSVGGVLDLLDVERIEVLRGPQGTLFGRNTIGGAINITTKKPDDILAADLQMLVGSDKHFSPRASLNIPLSSDLFVKATAGWETQDGYVKRPDGRDTGDRNRLTGRLAARWQPSDALTFDLVFDGTRERTNGAAFVLLDTTAAGLYPLDPEGNPTPFPPNLKAGQFPFFRNVVLNGATCAGAEPPVTNPPALPACFGNHYIPPGLNQDFSNKRVFSNLDLWGVAFTAAWEVGGATLKFITSYRDTEAAYNIDQDHTPVQIADVDTTSTHWQLTQELQIVGTAMDGQLDYIFGLFHFREKARSIELVRFPVVYIQSGGRTNNDSIAGFAQATYRILPSLSLTGGLRYTSDTKRFTPESFVIESLIGLPPGFPVLPANQVSRTFRKWTPMINLAWKPDDDLLIYGTYSQGFKSGGFTQRVFPPLPETPSFAPETATVYEAGFKWSGAENRVRLNGAAYSTSYRDVQITVQNISVAPIILNAARARIRGGELEFVAVPTPPLTIEAAVGYINARFLETAPGAQVTTANRLLKTPEWTLHASAAYRFDLGRWGLTPRVDWSYRSRTENNAINSPQISQPGFSLFDIGVMLDNDDGFSIIARLQNVTDKRYITGAFSDDISLGLSEAVLDRGRQWSLTLRKSF